MKLNYKSGMILPAINHRMRDDRVAVVSGTVTGLISTFVFNPVDRALYLHISKRRRLFDPANWRKPMHGVTGSLFQKVISYGYYYSMIDIVGSAVKKNIRNEYYHPFATGLVVGTTTSILTNPLNVIRYHQWGNDDLTTRKTMLTLKNNYGYGVLTRGLLASINRDSLFTTIYTFTLPYTRRFSEDNESRFAKFILNAASATVATLASSPFNYLRNVKYRDIPTGENRSSFVVIGNLIQHAYRDDSPVMYIMRRFSVGWGTLRVSLGIGFGQLAYDEISGMIRDK